METEDQGLEGAPRITDFADVAIRSWDPPHFTTFGFLAVRPVCRTLQNIRDYFAERFNIVA